jgi:death on curing protein
MIFLRKSEVLALHHALIDEFGGSHGVLNEGALESALVAPENRRYYEDAGLAACAAAYAYHFTQAHAFVDGNKRVGAGAMEQFLVANGAALVADDDSIYDLIMGIADGSLARDDVERWLHERVREG